MIARVDGAPGIAHLDGADGLAGLNAGDRKSDPRGNRMAGSHPWAAEDFRPRGLKFWLFAALWQIPGYGRKFYHDLERHFAPRAMDRFMAVAEALGPGDLALDLGANVGDITDLMSKGGAEVHAFEPEPETCAILRERFEGRSNVHVHEAAVSDFDGTADLILQSSFKHDPLKASEASSIVHEFLRNDEVDPRRVEVMDIRRILRKFKTPVKVMKIDVEGSEWSILEAMREAGLMDRAEAIFVETHEHIDHSIYRTLQKRHRRYASTKSTYVNLFWP